jgi:phosphoglycerol transferase MdoB-like AlkP superfamily enzyme
LASLLTRTILLFNTPAPADLTIVAVLRIFLQGAVFDLGVAVFIAAFYSLYLLFVPAKWNRSWMNKLITYTVFCLVIFVLLFSFFAEVTFWQEFESRFNFIAVDYLIYTYEVVNNINESYPLPWLIGGMLALTGLVFFAFYKWKIFQNSFNSETPFLARLMISASLILLAFVYGICIDNDQAELSNNRYQNELSKAGIYSFVSAFKNNELSYDHFYKTIDNNVALAITNSSLVEDNVIFENPLHSIRRVIRSNHATSRPNVIMITIESLSADFLGSFGNRQGMTPFLDSLAGQSLLFTNMYATGTRTVRGMEALSLSIPPTPGSSIVRRPGNSHLYTVGTIFKNAGYDRTFLYGGDGYFDNMNQYFGSNGFDVTDRGRKIAVGDNYTTKRTIIRDSLVHFENAWGICDEDLYDAVIRDADEKYGNHHPFYQFVMTTSNHRPYTYPAGKIDIPSGSGREGAVKYTDYALRQLFQKIKNKPWYANTIIILVADHCAGSAGKN